MTDSLKYRTIIRCFNSLKIILFELDQLKPNCRNWNWNISKTVRDSCIRSIKSIFSSFPSIIWSELRFYPSGRCRVIENSQHFFENILWSGWNYETEHGLWPSPGWVCYVYQIWWKSVQRFARGCSKFNSASFLHAVLIYIRFWFRGKRV